MVSLSNHAPLTLPASFDRLRMSGERAYIGTAKGFKQWPRIIIDTDPGVDDAIAIFDGPGLSCAGGWPG